MRDFFTVMSAYRWDSKALAEAHYKAAWGVFVALIMIDSIVLSIITYSYFPILFVILPYPIFRLYIVCRDLGSNFFALSPNSEGQVRHAYLVVLFWMIAITLSVFFFYLLGGRADDVMLKLVFTSAVMFLYGFLLLPLVFIREEGQWWLYFISTAILFHFYLFYFCLGDRAVDSISIFGITEPTFSGIDGMSKTLITIVFAILAKIAGYQLSCRCNRRNFKTLH